MRLLLVEDHADLAIWVSKTLRQSGFAVDVVGRGDHALTSLLTQTYDLAILDLSLPGMDGLEVLRRMRSQEKTARLPVLILTARSTLDDKVKGLNLGADDYLAKPFGPRELLARLRALLRRSQTPAGAAAPGEGGAALPPAERWVFGPFQLDAAAHRLLRDGQEVPLTSAEYALLAAFCQHPARVLSRDLLVDLLKGHERDAFDRSIDSRVTRLRRKIEDDPAAPLYIRTVRGEGYLFNPRGGAV